LDNSDEVTCSGHENGAMFRDNFLLVTDKDESSAGVYQVDLATGRTRQCISERHPVPVAVVFDAITSDIFYSDIDLSKIQKYSHSTKTVTSILSDATGRSNYDGLALDVQHRKIYYANHQHVLILDLEGVIGEVSTTGSDHRVIYRRRGMEPRAIVVDSANRVLYWTDWGVNPSICKIKLAPGATVEAVVQGNLTWPNALTIDFSKRVMYWADISPLQRCKVEMANLDGTGRRTILEQFGVRYYAITLDATYLYLTDWTSSSIRRIHRTTFQASLHFSQHFGSPSGIFLYNSTWNREQREGELLNLEKTTRYLQTTAQLSTSQPFIVSTTVVAKESTTFNKLLSAEDKRAPTINPTHHQSIASASSTEATGVKTEPSLDPSVHSWMWNSLRQNTGLYLVCGVALAVTLIIAVTVCIVYSKKRKANSVSFSVNEEPVVVRSSDVAHNVQNQYDYIPAAYNAVNMEREYMKSFSSKPNAPAYEQKYGNVGAKCFDYCSTDDDYLKPSY